MPGVVYLEKFRQMLLGLGYFSRGQVESIVRTARGFAGGKARGERIAESREFAAIEELTPENLKAMPPGEVISIHRRLHMLWSAPHRPSVETLANAHTNVVAEMLRRGFNHYRRDELDDKGMPKEAQDGEEEKKGQEEEGDLILVPDYVSVVGSAVADVGKAQDIDVLVRDEEPAKGDKAAKGWLENVLIRVRQMLDPDKKGKELHLLFNPQGPHGDYIPLADLVLRQAVETGVKLHVQGTIINERDLALTIKEELLKTLGRKATVEAMLEEEEPRGDLASRFWGERWWKMFPKSGKARFVFHHHWRGLSEEETKLSEAELLKTDHSVHGDLRMESSPEELFGFTIFLGTAEDVRKGRDLDTLPPDDRLQGNWKLSQPHDWLDVGKGGPAISEPEGVGATSEKSALFTMEDIGTYQIGVWREHSFEFFFSGAKVKGRYLITYAPVGEGRKWLIGKPGDQTPYAEANKLESVMAELRAKRQPHLVWAKPGEEPKLIRVY